MFRETAEGVEISLHVLPNAPKSQVIGAYNGLLKVKIHAPPVDGKANSEIVRFFSDFFGVSKNQVEICKGEKSKAKKILVRGLPLLEIQSRLSQNTNL